MLPETEVAVPTAAELKLNPAEPAERLDGLHHLPWQLIEQCSPVVADWYAKRVEQAHRDFYTREVRDVCREVLQIFIRDWPINASLWPQAQVLINQLKKLHYKIQQLPWESDEVQAEALMTEALQLKMALIEGKSERSELMDESHIPQIVDQYGFLKRQAQDLFKILG